jgi:preprotein translocase subunit YajC
VRLGDTGQRREPTRVPEAFPAPERIDVAPLILLLIFIPIFWLLIVRPQQQRQKAHAELVASLQAGDRVEGFSGIHGTLTEVGERTVRMEIAPGVVITMAKMAVAGRIDDHTEEA